MFMKRLCIDAGGTFIKYAWFENKIIVDQNKIETPYKSKEAFYECIRQIWDAEVGPKEGISISLPGTINPVTGYVVQGGSLQYHNNFEMRAWYESRFNTPIFVENDARCAALAEMTAGNMRDIENGIVLTFGTGVGGCFIINKEIYRGSHLFSGEVSVLICDSLEEKGREAFLGNKLGIGHLINSICKSKGVEIAEGRKVFEWIQEGDIIANQLFSDYCKVFAEQIFNMQIMLDPQRVCIGGGVSENPVFMNGISNALTSFYDNLPVDMIRVDMKSCKFHNDSNLWGAYYNYEIRQSKE